MKELTLELQSPDSLIFCVQSEMMLIIYFYKGLVKSRSQRYKKLITDKLKNHPKICECAKNNSIHSTTPAFFFFLYTVLSHYAAGICSNSWGNCFRWIYFWHHISKAVVKHKKHKINELDFAVLCIRLTSSQTSGLFLSDKNFSTTGSLFSKAAFRNWGTSTGSV